VQLAHCCWCDVDVSERWSWLTGLSLQWQSPFMTYRCVRTCQHAQFLVLETVASQNRHFRQLFLFFLAQLLVCSQRSLYYRWFVCLGVKTFFTPLVAPPATVFLLFSRKVKNVCQMWNIFSKFWFKNFWRIFEILHLSLVSAAALQQWSSLVQQASVSVHIILVLHVDWKKWYSFKFMSFSRKKSLKFIWIIYS